MRKTYMIEFDAASPVKKWDTAQQMRSQKRAVDKAQQKLIVALRKHDPDVTVHPRKGAIIPVLIVESLKTLAALRPLLRLIPGVKSVRSVGRIDPID